MNNRPSIRHAWRARTQREQWLLTGALVASLLVGSYGFANTRLTEWLERLSPQSGASPAQVIASLRCSPPRPMSGDARR